MTLIESIFLGVLQGVTEFLPVSSSGHLVIFENIFGIEEGNLFYGVMLHFSTVLAVMIYYYKDVINLAKGLLPLMKKMKNNNLKKLEYYEKLLVLIIVGSIPTAIIGLLFEDLFEKYYNSLIIVGYALIITGILLLVSQRYSNPKYNLKEFKTSKSIIVGIFQGLAITPGISRSGSTIVGSLLLGLEKKEAAKYSFLLSIPSILGATILQLFKLESNLIYFNINLLSGMLASFIFGMLSIKLLVKTLVNGKLHYFSIYVFILGFLLLTVF